MAGLLIAFGGTAYSGVIGVADADLASAVQGATGRTPQDGKVITRDLTNGLDWLDWSVTTLINADTMEANYLNPGQLLDGWRYATDREFLALARSAGIGPDRYVFGPGGTTDGLSQETIELIDLLGDATAHESTWLSRGITAARHTPGVVYFVNLAVGDSPPLGRPLTTISIGSLPRGTANPSVGHALVRITPVPLPPAVWMGLGMLGLVGLGRKLKRRRA